VLLSTLAGLMTPAVLFAVGPQSVAVPLSEHSFQSSLVAQSHQVDELSSERLLPPQTLLPVQQSHDLNVMLEVEPLMPAGLSADQQQSLAA
jgi:hypothetical protein